MAQSSNRVTLGLASSRSAFNIALRGCGGCGHLVRRVCQTVAFYALLAIFGASCALWGLVSAILLVLPRRLGEPIGQFLIMAGFRFIVGLMRTSGIMRCDLAALDGLRDRGPLIIAPNHPTLLDVMLIVSRLPRVVCTAKSRLLSHPLWGASARLAGYIPNDAPFRFVREALHQLRAERRQLLIFPEGTRSDSTIGTFKPGFALIAREANVPIQAIFIESNSHFLAKGWGFFRMPAFPLVYRVRLGPVLHFAGERRDFVARMEKAYRREIDGGDR
jgi:1-acyl-sn-glycerol-3-phosphate acyltransferase